MNIQLNHFKTRGVFDVTTKQYEDISFIQNTEQVHTHNHIYQFVTPQMSQKLDGIEPGSQANIIETIKIDGTALPVTNKEIDIPVATSTTTGMMTPEDKLKLESFEDKEFVISSALNDLNSRFSTVNGRIDAIKATSEDNELITSAALNDLYQLIQNLPTSSGGGTNPFEGYNVQVINSINEFTNNVDLTTPPTLFLVVPSISNNGGDRETPGVNTTAYDTGIIPYGGDDTTYFYSNSGKYKLVYYQSNPGTKVTPGDSTSSSTWFLILDPINIEFLGTCDEYGQDIGSIDAVSENIINLLGNRSSLLNSLANISSTVKFNLVDSTSGQNRITLHIPATIYFDITEGVLITFQITNGTYEYSHSIMIMYDSIRFDNSYYDITLSGHYYYLSKTTSPKSSEPNEK